VAAIDFNIYTVNFMPTRQPMEYIQPSEVIVSPAIPHTLAVIPLPLYSLDRR
jgi:hypothetical protein